MGCIGSRLAIVRNRSFSGSRRSSLRRQNVFPVLNVDDMGRQISPGKLEVSETDLVLHVRGKPSLTWPLRCLRRYGYDNDLFSFESGRRCPTGAGIFAFRCNRAQSLFNLLQSKIQGNPGTTPNTVPSTPITPTNTCSNNPSTPVSSTFVYVNLAENSSRQTTNAPDVTQVFVPCSLNSMNASSAGASFPMSQSYKQSHQLDNNTHPLYMNVEAPIGLPYGHYQNSSNSSRYEGFNQSVPSSAGPRSSSLVCPHPSQKAQSNDRLPSFQSSRTDSSPKDSTLYTNVICSPSTEKFNHAVQSGTAITEPAEVNYAELDLKTDNCSSSSTNPLFSSSLSSANKGRLCLLNNKENSKPSAGDSRFRLKFGKSNPPSTVASNVDSVSKRNVAGANNFGVLGTPTTTSPPTHGELGYATIDFDRTAALGVVTRSKINLDFRSSSSDDHDVSVRKTRHNSTAL